MSGARLSRSEVAALVDHTRLAPEATSEEIRTLCDDARRLGVFSVCVSPTWVADAARLLDGSPVRVCSVAGFPSGAHHSAIKRAEAERAVADGASEVDMVINLGQARAGAWDRVERDVAEVRSGVPEGLILKVIIEAAILDQAGVMAACGAAEQAGANFVKSSTGLHPAGGATLATIRLMSETVGGRLGVKASGGIASAHTALAMIDAGATRIGMSRTESVLGELD